MRSDCALFRGDHWNNKKHVTSLGLFSPVGSGSPPKAEPFVTELRFPRGDLESRGVAAVRMAAIHM
jgi:hypothetical protein